MVSRKSELTLRSARSKIAGSEGLAGKAHLKRQIQPQASTLVDWESGGFTPHDQRLRQPQQKTGFERFLGSPGR
jgi:hypothetical protein